MSSFIRRIQRKRQRQHPDYEAPSQAHRDLPDGGYQVYHPTRGWKTVSARRALAAMKLAQILDNGRVSIRKKAPRRVSWGQPKPVPEGRVTRQQRRAAERAS